MISCIGALPAGGRLTVSDEESVEDGAQLGKIREPADGVGGAWRFIAGCRAGIAAPVGPGRRDQRTAAVRQDDEQEQAAAALDGANDAEALALEGVAPSRHRHFVRVILGVGSVSPLPSTRSRMAS
jgi:hypothetical protein